MGYNHIMKRPEKITKLAFYLMDKEPLFYLFIINSDFIPDEVCFGSDYAAVRYQDGRVKFHYTTKFTELPIKQMYFVIIHEAYHIFKRHLSIHLDLMKINPLLVNIAEDAIINTEILHSKFNGIEPDAKGLSPFFVPDDFIRDYKSLGNDALVTPRLFNWYLNKNKLNKKDALKQSGFCKNTKTGKYGKIQYEYEDDNFYISEFNDLDHMMKNANEYIYNFQPPTQTTKGNINDLIPVFINSNSGGYNQATYDGESESFGFSDSHEQLNKEPEEAEAINQQVFTQKIVKQAREMVESNPQLKKSAGKGSGNSILEKIEELLKPEVSWKKIFKKYVNLYNSDNSISKSKKKSVLTYLMNAKSRYGFIFPHYLKVKDKLQKYVFVAVDTSGSCFSDKYDMERFFSEIDSIAEELEFSNTGRVFIMQWDWGITYPFKEYKKGDWKKFQIHGGGGTNPKCIFDYMQKTFTPVGSSLFGYLDGDTKKNPLFIPDKEKLPLLIILTDGYFYNKLEKTDLGLYEKNDKNILFITKSKRNLFDNARYIEYK
jgi:predicted metal-dependent peptidase